MRLHLPAIALGAALLAACSADAPAPGGNTALGDTVPRETPAPATPGVSPPGDANGGPPATRPTGGDARATFGGYGDVRFGMAATDMEAAWGGELKEVGKEFNPSCYFLAPAWATVPAEFNFMIGDGRFVRFGTESAKYLAPGGGRIGMTKGEIASLYPGRIEEQPHKYSDGLYLRIKDGAGGTGVLIFETDAKGDAAKVTEWRVGVAPHVDYVEGCS